MIKTTSNDDNNLGKQVGRTTASCFPMGNRWLKVKKHYPIDFTQKPSLNHLLKLSKLKKWWNGVKTPILTKCFTHVRDAHLSPSVWVRQSIH